MIFLCLLFSANKLPPLKAKILLLNSWHCRQHCYIYNFYYFCTLSHLVPVERYSDVHLYSQYLAHSVIRQFCSLISNGASVNENNKCVGLLEDSVSQGCSGRALFFNQTWFFSYYTFSLNSLRNANSCILQPASFTCFFQWNRPEDIRVLAGVLLQN